MPKTKNSKAKNGNGATLGIEAELFAAADKLRLGGLVDRAHRDLSKEDIAQIADTCHAWKNGPVGAIHESPLRSYTKKTMSPSSKRWRAGR